MNELTKAINQIKKYSSKSATLPVLQNVLLSLEDGTMTIAATDLTAYASVTFPCVGKNFATTTNLKKLEAVVKGMADPINFRLDVTEKAATKQTYNPDTREMDAEEYAITNEKLVVSSESTTVTLNTIPASEFPVKNPNGILLGEIDLSDIGRVLPFAATDDGRPILQCINLELGTNEAVVAAADGFKLAKMALPYSGEEHQSLLIPSDPLGKLPKGFTKANLYYSHERRNISLVAGDFTLAVHLTDGRFPDYSQIIPKANVLNSQFTVSVKGWLDATKGVKVFADETAGIVRHAIVDNTMTVSAMDEERNTIQKEVWAEKTGEYPVFALNYDHLTAILKACEGDTVTVKLAMPAEHETQYNGKPRKATSQALTFTDGTDWMAVCMPMSVREDY